jgi:hypothetical protein
VAGTLFPPCTLPHTFPATHTSLTLFLPHTLLSSGSSLIKNKNDDGNREQKHTSNNTTMLPKKKPPSLEEAQTNGSRFMKDFFPAIKKPRKPGRPKRTEEEIATEITNQLIRKHSGCPPKNPAVVQAKSSGHPRKEKVTTKQFWPHQKKAKAKKDKLVLVPIL